MKDIEGKVVLITGGSTGIGAAAARAFAGQGARTMVHYNASREAAADLVADIARSGGEAQMIGGDVRDLANVSRVIDQTAQKLGRLDVLVNNVGSLVKRTPVTHYSIGLLDEVLNINVRQLVWFVREAALVMRRQGGGNIINTTSIAARNGGGPGSVLYAAAKGFVSTATRGWARELADDKIRVNAVSPGVILTPFHERFTTQAQLSAMQTTVPMQRLGEPEECAGAFLYLASDDLSGYVTGQTVEVNGGQWMA